MKDNYQEEVEMQMKGLLGFLRGPDSSPECFISSTLFVLHIKDYYFPMNFDCGEDGGAPSAVERARAELAVRRRGWDACLALAVNAWEGALQQRT